MVFSSAIFVFGFLPAFLTLYYLAPMRARSAVILLGSYAFYGWWRLDYLALIFGMSLVSYAAAHVAHTTRSGRVKTWAVRLGVLFDLAVLGYFKYTMFALTGLSDLSVALGGGDITVPAIILPIGISFHTFQSISYIIDVARKDAPPARNLIDFLAFGSLFPQLIAGPVLRYKDLSAQFANRTHSAAKFLQGAGRFSQGLAMKLLIADSVAPLADRLFAISAPSASEAWLGALAYAIQLFFDFAGYSAMAIGLGLMIGFRFVENFDAPYGSQSITEFWRRWHISLSHWLRDYLYLPLGGNRKGRLRTYFNLMLTMVLGGLWHGANWTFLLWGAWHGAWLAIERALGAKSAAQVWPRMIGWPVTMSVVLIGWVMFRAASVEDAFQIYAGMVGVHGWVVTTDIAWQIRPTELTALAVGMALCAPGQWLQRPIANAPRLLRGAGAFSLMTASCLALIAQTHSPFLYFQF
ncbi:MBOAT family protein [uncultured Roseobacter sp.]|uniref:MBOAT family O-acyltransferase n=1 Tax=uncultured Roseobacter sp. TaxID=114847 RepID=UPI00261F1557|nr:MBOAT family protein [uncultured Roseobacter sp.]